MHFVSNEIYHIYNRGNQKQEIFKSRENYLNFLEKVKTNIASRCEILAWCLMPNHFHILVSTTEISCDTLAKAVIPIQYLSEGIRLLLSSYTKGFNRANELTGNLFQQKTKAKMVSNKTENYSRTAFHYIHQNPMTADLVKKMEDWEFSSFRDYIGTRNGKFM